MGLFVVFGLLLVLLTFSIWFVLFASSDLKRTDLIDMRSLIALCVISILHITFKTLLRFFLLSEEFRRMV